MSTERVSVYEFEDYRLDVGRRILVSADNKIVDLTPKAAEILCVLVENAGKVVSKEELRRRVWPDLFVEEANLANHVFHLRKALGEESGKKIIETIPKRGYRFVAELRQAQGGQQESETTQNASTWNPWKKIPIALVSLLVLILAGWYIVGRINTTEPPGEVVREKMEFSRIIVSGDVGAAFISPDARLIARIVRDRTGTGIKLRQLASPVEIDLLPPAKVHFIGDLIFSHDSNNIYYVAGVSREVPQLFRVSVLGGEPRKILDHIDSGITLSPDGARLAFMRRGVDPHREDQLVTANEDGTGQRVITSWQPPDALVQPIWSPHGEVFASLLRRRDDQGEYSTVDTTNITDRTTKTMTLGPWLFISSLRWLPDGTGVVVTGKPRSAPSEDRAQLWLLPYPKGEPQKITNDANGYGTLSIAADGRTALTHNVNLASNIWILPDGDVTRARQITDSNTELGEVDWTPGGQIVYASGAGTRFLDLWLMNADGSGPRQLTFTPEERETSPSVSPDGKSVVYILSRKNLFSIFRTDLDGGGPIELVHDVGDIYPDPRFSPDSEWVFYNLPDVAEPEQRSFWKIPARGGRPVKIRDREPCRISSDAKKFACVHFERKPQIEVKLRIVDGGTGEVLQTLNWPPDTNSIFWAPDGKSFDFVAERDGASNVWRLDPATGKQQKITDWQTRTPIYSFAWSRDGKDLAVVRDSQTTEIILIQNFAQ